MKNNFLKIILGLVWATSVFAQEVEFSGDIETLWGVGAPWTDEDVAAGKFTLANTAFTGKLDAYYNNSSAYAEATFTYDAAGALNGAGGSGQRRAGRGAGERGNRWGDPRLCPSCLSAPAGLAGRTQTGHSGLCNPRLSGIEMKKAP